MSSSASLIHSSAPALPPQPPESSEIQPLLQQIPVDSSQTGEMSDKIGIDFLRGKALVTAITSVCSAGFLLFGYDNGVMSGVVISVFWLDKMDNPSTIIVSTIVALFNVGAMIGAVMAAFTAESMGRKRTLIFGASAVIIGAVLMGTSFERIQMMVSRVITGVGIGYITSVTPVYQSEISVAAQRGWHVCAQLSTMLFGLMLAYWINYGLYFHESDIQWRFPLLFQCIFAVYILVITPFLPDTPRWLMSHDQDPARGIKVLAKLRGLDEGHSKVIAEKDDIMEAIKIESKEEGTWGDLIKDGGISVHKRFYLALGIQFMQQMSGINIITYYAPTLFQSSLGLSQEKALLLGSFLQLFYIIASFLTWVMIDRIGRRKLFISMACGMSLILILEAICVSINNTRATIAAIVLIFAFEACFTWGWMATVWLYPAEILPLKIRAKGAALATASDFLGNFIVVEITPPALKNIGYKTYIIFAVFNLINSLIVWCFYPETAGKKLEEVDQLFLKDWEDENQSEDINYVQTNLQWKIVRRSMEQVHIAKSRRGNELEGSVAAVLPKPDSAI